MCGKVCLFLGMVGKTVVLTVPGPEEACNASTGAAGPQKESKTDMEIPDATHADVQTRSEDIR